MKSQTKLTFSSGLVQFPSLPDQQFAMFVGSSNKQSEHNRTETTGQFHENLT